MEVPKFTLIFLISIIVTLTSLLIFSPFAKKFGIVDKPSERKIHNGNIPLVGGISIFIGVFVSMFFELAHDLITLSLVASGFFILLLGFIDDCYPLSVTIKVVFQIIIVSIMVWATELRFDSFGHSFGLDKQIHLGIFSYPITVMGVVFVTNAFNLMDGADGVAGSLVLLSIIGINIVEIFSGHYNFNILSFAILGGLIPYLYFNLIKSNEKKIFLGDNGSLFLGYSVAFLLLYESQIHNSFSPPFALWVIAIPIFDVISVMVYRFKNSRALFAPDRSHLHNFFQRLGFSNSFVLISIIVSGVFCLMLGLVIEYIARPLSFPIYLISLVIYVWLRNFSKFSKI